MDDASADGGRGSREWGMDGDDNVVRAISVFVPAGELVVVVGSPEVDGAVVGECRSVSSAAPNGYKGVDPVRWFDERRCSRRRAAWNV